MKKFLVLYKAPLATWDKLVQGTPEQRKVFMEAWMAWAGKAAKAIVELGAPLGKSLKVTPAGASPTRNELGGYSIMQGDSKEAVAEELKGHPHFMEPECYIEITEMMPM
jgi:hypothetical protein